MATSGNARRQLIVNADDFGRSPGINRGIIAGHLHGIVTSTTLMVNLPWTGEAVRLCNSTPNLGVGLHLNFCYGSPSLVKNAVPSLTAKDGNFESDLAQLASQIQAPDVEREARAQLDRFLTLMKRPPTHIDSHKHLHCWPECREPVIAIAREYNLPVRPATPEMAARLLEAEVPAPDHFEERFHDIGEIDTSDLTNLIEQLKPGCTELMCHPGYIDEWIADSSLRIERERQLKTLCSPQIRAAIKTQDIELLTYREV